MPTETPSPFLTAGQRRTVGFSLALLAFLAAAAALVVAFVVLGRMVSFFSSVLWPLAVAGVLALILRPVVELLERRLHLRRLTAVVLLYGTFVLLLGALVVILVPPLVEQVLAFIAYVPVPLENATNYLQQNYPQWIAIAKRQLANPTIRQIANSLVGESKELLAQAMPSLRAAGGGLIGVFAFTTHLAIIPVYLFFFLLARGEPTRNLPDHLPFLKPEMRKDVVFLVREFVAIVESFFRGQILIGIIMGVLLAIGFTVVGLRFGLFIGLVLGILNIVPYLGTILGLAITLPLAFFQPGGGWQLLGLMLLVYSLVQAVEGWVLTPKIMGDRTGLHPVTIIVAIFFWGTAFGGVLGMLLAIPLTAFFVTVWRLAKRKYLSAADA